MATKVLEASKLIGDDRYFCEHLIEIEDRYRRRMAFKFNPAQELLYQDRHPREAVVKAGQLGITTYYLALHLKDTITHPGTTSVIVAHDEFLAQRLLQRTDFWYNQIPDTIEMRLPDGTTKPFPKPYRKHNSSYEKSFPKINSHFYIGTARAFVFGRGEPIHNFQGSEVAFWPDAWRVLTPVLDRVPLNGGHAVLESTPNGDDEENAFYAIVEEARNDPNTFWHLHELYWWLEETYRLPRGDIEALPLDKGPLDFTQEEVALIRRVGWDDSEAEDRIRWRRLKLKQNRQLFFQEFMEDISSCFMSTARSYYDHDELDRLQTSILDPQKGFKHAKVWYEPDDEWERPNYMISVDPGQGKYTLSVALVWRFDPPSEEYPLGRIRHEASLADLYDPVTFAPMVKELGYYYKTAKISAERNGHGMAFCAEIMDYPNLYYQTDNVSGVQTKVVGWKTTGAPRVNGTGTKTYMIEELNHALQMIVTHDEDLIAQIRRVRITSEGKIEVPKFDDYHDAACIMAATRSTSLGFAPSGIAFQKRGWR